MEAQLDASLATRDQSSPAPAAVSSPVLFAPSDVLSPDAAQAEDIKRSSATPPPSSQPPKNNHAKHRTPTPTFSHISTPPPTNDIQMSTVRPATTFTGIMTPGDLATATPEDLRAHVAELQTALHDAKMMAAHHRLQYQMLSQESATAIDRMAVEARMAQYENDIIHVAEQAKMAPLATSSPPVQTGFIPVQKELYQTMCREIKALHAANSALATQNNDQQKTIFCQETEVASLTDKVTLMRERIRESREQILKYRKHSGNIDSAYGTPQRSHRDQSQPFAALLQASEMMSQEPTPHRLSGKRGHARNAQSLSSLPSTPQRPARPGMGQYQTPQDRQPQFKVPATAPAPRTSALRTPDAYHPKTTPASAKTTTRSEDTITASDNNDSEAETDILQPDDEISESHASRSASLMLRSSQEHQQKLDSLKGSGMRQTKIFGTLRKAHVDRSGERPSKRARTNDPAIGLGIAGVRQ